LLSSIWRFRSSSDVLDPLMKRELGYCEA